MDVPRGKEVARRRTIKRIVYIVLAVKAYSLENVLQVAWKQFAALSDWNTACLGAHKLRRCAVRGKCGFRGSVEVCAVWFDSECTT